MTTSTSRPISVKSQVFIRLSFLAHVLSLTRFALILSLIASELESDSITSVSSSVFGNAPLLPASCHSGFFILVVLFLCEHEFENYMFVCFATMSRLVLQIGVQKT